MTDVCLGSRGDTEEEEEVSQAEETVGVKQPWPKNPCSREDEGRSCGQLKCYTWSRWDEGQVQVEYVAEPGLAGTSKIPMDV